MAYQPYNYGPYQPYYNGQLPDQLSQLRMQQIPQNQPMPGMAQPMQQPQMMAQPVPQSHPENGGIIWVQGEAGAKAYMVASGNTVPLWDSENQIIYLKSVDLSGMPSMRVLDYSERGGQSQKNDEPMVDYSQFITRDELENILSERLKKPVRITQKKEDNSDG